MGLNIGSDVEDLATGNFIGAGADILGSIFGGGEDKGHWQGNLFIPGDLQNRKSAANAAIYAHGLLPSDVDQNVITAILESQGVWQDNISNYLNIVEKDKAQKVYDNVNVNTAVGSTTPAPPVSIGANLTSNSTLIIVVAIIAVAFFALR
jgi:hypothetical protein